MLEDLEKIPWSSLAQPEWNESEEVPAALRALVQSLVVADTVEERERALATELLADIAGRA